MSTRKRPVNINMPPQQIPKQKNENEQIDIHPDRTKKKHDHYPKEKDSDE